MDLDLHQDLVGLQTKPTTMDCEYADAITTSIAACIAAAAAGVLGDQDSIALHATRSFEAKQFATPARRHTDESVGYFLLTSCPVECIRVSGTYARM